MLGHPKPVAYRDRALLDLAKDSPCMFSIPGVCEWTPASQCVACHSNKLAHGKGRGRKADDHYTVSGCPSCHRWYDEGKATREDKDAAFERAHNRQVNWWGVIERDTDRPERQRNAARKAINQL